MSGWDDERWLDTATFLGRWDTANHVLRPAAIDPKVGGPFDAQALLDRAHRFWGEPALTDATRRVLLGFAQRSLGDAKQSWKRAPYAAMTENALRQLIAVSPDLQTS